MTASALRRTILRELGSLIDQVRAYPDDASPWTRPPGISNTGGTLVLHLCGNVRHFIGGQLGGSGYVRDRPAEFERTGLGREALCEVVDRAREEVATALGALDGERLGEAWPEEIFGHRLTVDRFLTHLLAHLAYHLGQLDYHRRVVTGEAGELRMLSIPRLADD